MPPKGKAKAKAKRPASPTPPAEMPPKKKLLGPMRLRLDTEEEVTSNSAFSPEPTPPPIPAQKKPPKKAAKKGAKTVQVEDSDPDDDDSDGDVILPKAQTPKKPTKKRGVMAVDTAASTRSRRSTAPIEEEEVVEVIQKTQPKKAKPLKVTPIPVPKMSTVTSAAKAPPTPRKKAPAKALPKNTKGKKSVSFEDDEDESPGPMLSTYETTAEFLHQNVPNYIRSIMKYATDQADSDMRLRYAGCVMFWHFRVLTTPMRDAFIAALDAPERIAGSLVKQRAFITSVYNDIYEVILDMHVYIAEFYLQATHEGRMYYQSCIKAKNGHRRTPTPPDPAFIVKSINLSDEDLIQLWAPVTAIAYETTLQDMLPRMRNDSGVLIHQLIAAATISATNSMNVHSQKLMINSISNPMRSINDGWPAFIKSVPEEYSQDNFGIDPHAMLKKYSALYELRNGRDETQKVDREIESSMDEDDDVSFVAEGGLSNMKITRVPVGFGSEYAESGGDATPQEVINNIRVAETEARQDLHNISMRLHDELISTDRSAFFSADAEYLAVCNTEGLGIYMEYRHKKEMNAIARTIQEYNSVLEKKEARMKELRVSIRRSQATMQVMLKLAAQVDAASAEEKSLIAEDNALKEKAGEIPQQPITTTKASTISMDFGSNFKPTESRRYFGDRPTTMPTTFAERAPMPTTFGDRPTTMPTTFAERAPKPTTFGEKPTTTAFGERATVFGERATTNAERAPKLSTFGEKATTFAERATTTSAFADRSASSSFADRSASSSFAERGSTSMAPPRSNPTASRILHSRQALSRRRLPLSERRVLSEYVDKDGMTRQFWKYFEDSDESSTEDDCRNPVSVERIIARLPDVENTRPSTALEVVTPTDPASIPASIPDSIPATAVNPVPATVVDDVPATVVAFSASAGDVDMVSDEFVATSATEEVEFGHATQPATTGVEENDDNTNANIPPVNKGSN